MRKMPIVLAVLTALLLAAIATTGSQAKPQKAAVTTVSLNGWVGAKVEDDLLKEVIAAFEKSHPNIKVNYDAFNNYQTTMLAKFSARQPPDVFYVAAEDFADWVRQGVMQPLDAYAKKSKFASKPFYSGLLRSFKFGGRSTGIRRTGPSLAMEVNPALMGGQKVPTTWAQLRAVAQRINIPGGKPICLSADWVG